MSNNLIVAALKSELGNEFDGLRCLVTGVGKINASYELTKEIYSGNCEFYNKGYIPMRKADRPSAIINFGTAVSKNIPHGKMIQVLGAFQYDMKCAPITGSIGITPFEEGQVIISKRLLEDVPAFICGSGDSFIEAGHPALELFEICDMECYALFKVSQRENIPFYSFKYVTDSGSTEDWEKNIPLAAQEFRKVYDRIKCLI